MFVVIVVALRSFEAFDTVQIFTRGGPGRASEVLPSTGKALSICALDIGVQER
jgi:ABC-type sugar transport system permease subunit